MYNEGASSFWVDRPPAWEKSIKIVRCCRKMWRWWRMRTTVCASRVVTMIESLAIEMRSNFSRKKLIIFARSRFKRILALYVESYYCPNDSLSMSVRHSIYLNLKLGEMWTIALPPKNDRIFTFYNTDSEEPWPFLGHIRIFSWLINPSLSDKFPPRWIIPFKCHFILRIQISFVFQLTSTSCWVNYSSYDQLKRSLVMPLYVGFAQKSSIHCQ